LHPHARAQVKAAICENVNLYLEKNETEFAPYLNDFATAVWSLLLTVRLRRACTRCHDACVVRACVGVASRGVRLAAGWAGVKQRCAGH
jgi:hypothetical protein